MIRTLDQVQRDINEAYGVWHALLRQQAEGRDVTPAIDDVEEQLDRLFAEKRWLMAGAVSSELASIAALLDARMRMSLHKSRTCETAAAE